MIVEGKAKIVTDGVFYNPRMKFCRDLDMLVFSEIRANEYLDALAATGIRGIRAVLEAEYNAVFNDINPRAVEVIKRNLEINGIEAEVHNREASSLMKEVRFEHIDLDPFGSPSEFVDAACHSAKKYLSVTATDTAALCGSATVSGLRKYSAYAIKTEVYPEIGLRMLIGKIAREATKYEKVVEVAVSWAREHYYRVHVKLRKSTSQSGKIYGKIGYIFYCKDCLSRKVVPMDGSCYEMCECGSKYTMLGPLWLGELKNQEIVEKIWKKSERKEKRFLERIVEECDAPYAYNVQEIARRLGVQTPKVSKVVEKLREVGYKASKTHFSGLCIKTNAGAEDVKRAILASNT